MKLTLIAVTLIGLIAVLGAVIIGNMTAEDTVVEHPYERGLDWDRENNLRRDSGLSVALNPGKVEAGVVRVEINIKERTGKGFEGEVLLKLTRPDTGEFDRRYKAINMGSGRYYAKVDLLKEGVWHVHIEVEYKGESISFLRKISAKGIKKDVPR